jgi:hypothetical protein
MQDVVHYKLQCLDLTFRDFKALGYKTISFSTTFIKRTHKTINKQQPASMGIKI